MKITLPQFRRIIREAVVVELGRRYPPQPYRDPMVVVKDATSPEELADMLINHFRGYAYDLQLESWDEPRFLNHIIPRMKASKVPSDVIKMLPAAVQIAAEKNQGTIE